MEHTYIVAPIGAKYLSEVPEMFDGLPKNCLFNKVTTGCGGTYVALTSSEPYIIAVPTKALVEDKIKSEGYANVKLLAVSGDYNFTNHEGKSFGSVPEGYDKIICTYQQLENVTRKVNPTDWHLLVDEMHLILRMASFCGGFLTYMMENFKQYKSYCFMSATIPREEWLLDELKVIPRVTMDWPSTTDVKFYGLKAESVKESLLQICDDHLTGKREGNAYFFYNSISGICSILRNLKKIPEVKQAVRVISARSSQTKAKIAKEGFKISSSADPHGVINFVTSAAFEGADFLDENGVTYIVTEDKYEHTKYSITTAVPQIVGRLRNSKYKDRVYVLFDKSTVLDARTPEELSAVIDNREGQARSIVSLFGYAKTLVPPESAMRGAVREACMSIYNLIEGLDIPIEEISADLSVEDSTLFSIDVLFNRYARYVDLEYYYTLSGHHKLVATGEVKLPTEVAGCSCITGVLENSTEAPPLSAATKAKYRRATVGVKTFREIADEDPERAKELDPELWSYYEVIGRKGFIACDHNKTKIKAKVKKEKQHSAFVPQERIDAHFKVGFTYRRDYIYMVLEKYFKITTGQIPWLKARFEIKRTSQSSHTAYKILKVL